MKLFQIDFKKLVVLLLPTFLRGRKIISVLQVAMEPLVRLHERTFLPTREKSLFEIHHTGQVCHIKDALDKQFGLSYSEGFQIEDINSIGEWIFAYDETEWLEDQQTIVEDDANALMAYDELIITAETKSFVVIVPQGMCEDVSTDKKVMPIVRSLVEKYRLVSRLPEYKLSTL